MADTYLYGGQNTNYFFRVKKGASSYTIVQIDGETAATLLTDASLKLTETQKTRPEFQDDGTVNGTWENYQWGGDVLAFLNAVARPAGNASRLPEWYNEKGVKKGPADADSLVLWINYGAYDSDNSKYYVQFALGIIKASSGSHDQQSGDYAKPVLSFEGRFAEFALTVPVGLQDTDIITAAEKIIAANYCYVAEWMAEAV